MDVFSWLIVGHLVGDWLLQTDWMAQGKQQGIVNRAMFVHVSVYTVVIMMVISPGWSRQSISTLTIIAVYVLTTHWLIDAGKLAVRWGQMIGQTQVTFVRVMSDQTMHFIVLAALSIYLSQ